MADDTRLPRATPESQGVDPAAIERLVRAADEEGLGMHSLMVVRHGRVVAEGWWHPYTAERRHIMFSVSKSFTATAIGMAIAEGRLDLDEPILAFFPSYATPEVVRNTAGLTLRHVLSMATGHVTDTMEIMRALPQEDWVKIFLEVPIADRPGSRFLYNSGASFILSAIIAERTGQILRDYLTPRLFEPLGIETPPWQANARGINLGASGLRLTTEDLAKFGQLYLQCGIWAGQRLLSEDWVEQATSAHVSTGTDADSDWSQGYGFQFWRSRHDSYRADGAYGQFSLVVPDRDLVVAVTAGTSLNTRIPPAIWRELLPGVLDGTVSENPGVRASAVTSLRRLAIPAPAGAADDPVVAGTVGGRSIALTPNTFGVSSLSLEFAEDAVTVHFEGEPWGSERTRAGREQWLPGQTALWPYEEMDGALTANRATWVDDVTLEIHEQCVETPFRRVWRLRFGEADHVEVTVGLDHGFWADRTETLQGTLA